MNDDISLPHSLRQMLFVANIPLDEMEFWVDEVRNETPSAVHQVVKYRNVVAFLK